MIVASICARGGSKGVPRKNLRRLSGRSLIERAIDSARECVSIERIVVSTEDAEIADIALRAGADVPFTRPAELAQDTSPKWPVFQHMVDTLERAGARVEVLVDLDVACPLRTADDIAGTIAALRQSDAEVAVTVYEPERNPYFNMVELGPGGFASIVKPTQPPITSRQQAPRVFSVSPSVFAISRDALTRYSHWSQANVQVYEIPRERALDIDSDLDLRMAEFLLSTEAARA